MGTETGNAIQVMKRYELKYLLDRGQTAFLVSCLRGHMEPDRYGLTSIASLYYDTPDFRLVRASLDKPDFKEKLRLRSHGIAAEESPVCMLFRSFIIYNTILLLVLTKMLMAYSGLFGTLFAYKNRENLQFY